MSIQDDIFDVEYEVEGTYAEDSFERLCTYLNELEKTLEYYKKFYAKVENLRRMVVELEDNPSYLPQTSS